MFWTMRFSSRNCCSGQWTEWFNKSFFVNSFDCITNPHCNKVWEQIATLPLVARNDDFVGCEVASSYLIAMTLRWSCTVIANVVKQSFIYVRLPRSRSSTSQWRYLYRHCKRSEAICYSIVFDKSFHSGLNPLIKSSFFWREPALICFSLEIASSMDKNPS